MEVVEEEEIEEEEYEQQRKVGLKHSFISKSGGGEMKFHKAGFKQFLLLIVLCVYSVVGGVMFCQLENPHLRLELEKAKNNSERQKEKKEEQLEVVRERIEEIMRDVRVSVIDEEAELQNLTDVLEQSWSNRSRLERIKYFGKIEESILRAISWYDNISECRKVVEADIRGPWNIWEGIFYGWTLYSTIGYGNIYAQSSGGQIATIIFSLFGIPFLITLLNEWGNYLFTAMLFLWNNWLLLVHYLRNQTHRISLRRRRQPSFRTIGSIAVATGQLAGTRNLWQEARNSMKQVQSEDSDSKAGPASMDLPLVLVLIIFVVWIWISASIYCLFEGWTYFTSIYFVFISLTTIGLGDVSPAKPKYTVLSLVLILVCLSVISMALSVVQWKIEALFGRMIKKIDKEYQRKISEASSIQELEISPGMGDSVISSSPDSLHISTSSDVPLVKKGEHGEKNIPSDDVMKSIVAKEGFYASMLFRMMDGHKKKLLKQHENKRAAMRHRGVQAILTEPCEIGVQAGPDDTSKPIAEIYASGEFVGGRALKRTPFTRDIYVYHI